MTGSVLDEAYDRLRRTGPERNGWLSNHAPMVAEALVRRGRERAVHRWLDSYAVRLEEPPRGIAAIAADEWRDPLGDPVRTGDWLQYFDRELAVEPWRHVLGRWWPRLLPGIAAGATHGVIRVGHAVCALLDEETVPRVAELGQGLAYWAARWQPLAAPGAGPYRNIDPRSALDAVPRVPDQRFGIRARLAQLAELAQWPEVAGAVPSGHGEEEPDRLAAIVDAAVARHGTHGYASPVMLVHAATAPNAVLRTMRALPERFWPSSLTAAWAATAAITAAYSPAQARPVPALSPGPDADTVMSRATDSGDEHAIKFADTALDAYARRRDPAILANAAQSIDAITAD
ncbi:MAG TPA: hypothetical protein VF163_04800 [Micromonosporaceae bacterium]